MSCERSWRRCGLGVRGSKRNKRYCGAVREVPVAMPPREPGLLDWLADQLPVDGGQDLAAPIP
jgi:hypothetical protein